MTPNAERRAMPDAPYRINDFSLESIRNRQEIRVADALRTMLPGVENFCGCRLCVEDVYAFALNQLPAHYVQHGSLLVRKLPPTDADIRRAVADALDTVRVRPNHPE